MEFDETNGSQEEDENLDDVRGTPLINAMKHMDIGNIRPREVIDVKDDKNQVLSNSNVQASGSHDQAQARTSDDNVQDQQQVASSSSHPCDQSNASNQVQMLQPTNVTRDHPLVISQEVYKQDQDWHYFMNTSHLCLSLNLRR